MPSLYSIDYHFMRLAWLTAFNLSKDPNTQVASVIVSEDTREVSFGFNGMPIGIEETKEMWENRDLKHEYVIHSEPNAISNAPFDTKDCTIYVTHKPCHRCMGEIRNARIKRIVYNEDYIGKAINNEVWNNIAKLFKNITQLPDDDFLKYLKANKSDLSLVK